MDEHLQRAVQDEVADAGNDVFACQPLNDFVKKAIGKETPRRSEAATGLQLKLNSGFALP